MRPEPKDWTCATHGGSYAKHGACPECKTEERAGAAGAVDRALKKSEEPSYEADARAIAKVLVRHYGDEAPKVYALVLDFMPDALKAKR